MNFVYDPVQAAQLTYWVQYVSPVKGVRDELIKMGGDAAELADSPILFPSEEDSARLNVFAALPDELDARLTERFLQDHRRLTTWPPTTPTDRACGRASASRTSSSSPGWRSCSSSSSSR